MSDKHYVWNTYIPPLTLFTNTSTSPPLVNIHNPSSFRNQRNSIFYYWHFIFLNKIKIYLFFQSIFNFNLFQILSAASNSYRLLLRYLFIVILTSIYFYVDKKVFISCEFLFNLKKDLILRQYNINYVTRLSHLPLIYVCI